MKIKLVLSLSLMFSPLALGASYTLLTGNTANASGVANSAGVPFQNSDNPALAGPGIVSFGIFTTDDEVLRTAGSVDTLVSAFVQFGANPGTFTQPGGFANQGTFSRNAVDTVTGSEFAGRNMYVFVGNGPTFEESFEFLILRTDFTFNPADDGVPTPISSTITTENTTVIFGSLVDNVPTRANDTTVTPGWHTALIPEPSTALLGALGALGLLRRRRN